jgi:hypothetical protein
MNSGFWVASRQEIGHVAIPGMAIKTGGRLGAILNGLCVEPELVIGVDSAVE